MAQRVEQGLAHVPVMSGPLRRKQRAAVAAWNRNLLDDMIPAGKVSATGNQGFSEVADAFDSAYDALWANPITIGTPVRGPMVKKLQSAVAKLPPESKRSLGKLAKSVLPPLYVNGPIPGRVISELDDKLRSELPLEGVFNR